MHRVVGMMCGRLKKRLLAMTDYALMLLPQAQRNLPQVCLRALAMLRSNDEGVVLPADKNLGLVVMDRQPYVYMCLAHLGNQRNFVALSFDDCIQQYRQARAEYRSIQQATRGCGALGRRAKEYFDYFRRSASRTLSKLYRRFTRPRWLSVRL